MRLGDALADVPGLYLRGAAFGAGFPGSGQAVLSMRGIPRTLVMIDGQSRSTTRCRAASTSPAFRWQQLQDLIYRRRLSETLTRTENAGEADVNGIEASLQWPSGVRGLRIFGSLTHQFQYGITRNDAVPASVGKVLTDVPRITYSLGLDFDRQPWSGFLVYRHVGQVFGSGDDLNKNTVQGVFGSYDRYGIVSAKVGYRVDHHVSFSLELDNLNNQRYFVFNRRPGRTVFGELAYRF